MKSPTFMKEMTTAAKMQKKYGSPADMKEPMKLKEAPAKQTEKQKKNLPPNLVKEIAKAQGKGAPMKEPMKMKEAPVKQKYDSAGSDERVYDINQEKYDAWAAKTPGAPDIRYLGSKKNNKFLEAYLADKKKKNKGKTIGANDAMSGKLAKKKSKGVPMKEPMKMKDMESPTKQKMSYEDAFEYLTRGNKSDEKKLKEAKKVVRKSIKKGKKLEGEAFPGHFNQVPGSMYRKGTDEYKKYNPKAKK